VGYTRHAVLEQFGLVGDRRISLWILFLSASAIYLLLRQQVDRTEFDEIYSDDAPRPVALADLPIPTPGNSSGANAATIPATGASAAPADSQAGDAGEVP